MKHERKMRHVISFVLVLALVLSMFSMSFADTPPNFTANTDFTVVATTGQAVTLQAGPADSYYSFVGYETATEAAAGVDWSVVSSPSALIGSVSDPTAAAVTVTIGGVGVTRYASQVTVTMASSSSAYGAASILAQDESNSYNYVNFTLVLKNTGTADNVDTATVIESYGEEFAVNNTAVTTDISTASGALKYATPIDVLDAITSTGAITPNYDKYIYGYTQSSGYVSSVTGYSTTMAAITLDVQSVSPYRGWNYRVYKDGTMDPLSEVISAGYYKLSDDDEVVWYYGSYSEALTYFDQY